MFLGVYRFAGEPAALLAAYERLLAGMPTREFKLHVCAHNPQGLEIYDTCPSREVFESFAASVEFRDALAGAGLGTPAVHPIGEVDSVFAAGERLA